MVWVSGVLACFNSTVAVTFQLCLMRSLPPGLGAILRGVHLSKSIYDLSKKSSDNSKNLQLVLMLFFLKPGD